jgi:hypothetical protein
MNAKALSRVHAAFETADGFGIAEIDACVVVPRVGEVVHLPLRYETDDSGVEVPVLQSFTVRSVAWSYSWQTNPHQHNALITVEPVEAEAAPTKDAATASRPTIAAQWIALAREIQRQDPALWAALRLIDPVAEGDARCLAALVATLASTPVDRAAVDVVRPS